MTDKTAKTINLLELGNQLAISAKGFHTKIKTTHRPLIIRASTLAPKIEGLKALGDMPIFQMRESESEAEKRKGEFCVNTLTAYSYEGKCNIYTPDLTLISDFQIVGYKTGKYGYVNLKHKSGGLYTVAISVSNDHLLEMGELEKKTGENGLKGVNTPSAELLREVPNPEIPLWSNLLPSNEVLEVVSNGKFSKQHKTPLVDVKLPDGYVQKNVLCNSSLQNLYDEHGDGAKFKIVDKREFPRKDDSGKSMWIVNILDCQLDLSDL